MYSIWKKVTTKIETQFYSYYFRGSSKMCRTLAVTMSGAGAGIGSVKRFSGVQSCGVNPNKLRTVGLRGMHSTQKTITLGGMDVIIMPVLQDNYMYLVVCNKTREAAVIDPVDPEYVIRVVQENNIKLDTALTTHHHWDHAGGNEKLMKLWTFGDMDVYGGDPRVAGMTCQLFHKDVFKIGQLNVRCILTPCHTTGHMCYYFSPIDGESSGAVFTGDTLFQGGCGRFFEGIPEQMYDNLCKKLYDLPDDTKVFCGHEYTVQNLTYARQVEKDSQIIKDRLEWAKMRRAVKDPTVPSTIGEEKQWNPFMRVQEDVVQTYAGTYGDDPIDTMRTLRKEKDKFSG